MTVHAVYLLKLRSINVLSIMFRGGGRGRGGGGEKVSKRVGCRGFVCLFGFCDLTPDLQ